SRVAILFGLAALDGRGLLDRLNGHLMPPLGSGQLLPNPRAVAVVILDPPVPAVTATAFRADVRQHSRHLLRRPYQPGMSLTTNPGTRAQLTPHPIKLFSYTAAAQRTANKFSNIRRGGI